ncbi:hypothetical protein [Phyllobacterium salinisoli]|uniref:hypothetical protein n=1 Tax=Phyllobacterium salinisoli TaxID=1899321 RepID=UPI00267D772E
MELARSEDRVLECHEISPVAQNNVFQIASFVIVPVTLFRLGSEFGVLPSAGLEDDEVETLADPSEYGPANRAGFLLPEGAACERQAGREASPRLARAAAHSANSQLASRALASFALRGVREGVPQGAEKGKRTERRTRGASGRKMEKSELEELRVPCAAVLEPGGFAVDLKESTRRAVKYRRGDDIIIVIHEVGGWFDPLSDAKGDVFTLVEHLRGMTFIEVLDHVASLVGFVSKEPVWMRTARVAEPIASIPVRWAKRRRPWPGSMTWRYLRDERR